MRERLDDHGLTVLVFNPLEGHVVGFQLVREAFVHVRRAEQHEADLLEFALNVVPPFQVCPQYSLINELLGVSEDPTTDECQIDVLSFVTDGAQVCPYCILLYKEGSLQVSCVP